ncbi:C39 family peptidase [Candidatus Uhrbacteria bacterium]|nr:C39 family peptidase [Candidatus Uhrbacteria bacterium]
MKRMQVLLTAAIVSVALFGYASRGAIRDAVDALNAPKLPPARAYVPSIAPGEAVVPSAPSPVEGGVSASENYVLETNPVAKQKETDPLAFAGTLPTELNLDVPFTSQAPHANWDLPYQEACEEASSLMVDAFYDGKTGVIPPDRADDDITKLVAWEEETFGYYEDTTAEETARMLREYFGYRNVLVKPFATADDIKRVIANGYPVIIPAAGKLLGNPNFRNGGPDYHMLVIRGYTPTHFITNDPGTRKGRGYTYTFDTILNATHDWTGSKATVKTGARVMIVVIP